MKKEGYKVQMYARKGPHRTRSGEHDAAHVLPLQVGCLHFLRKPLRYFFCRA